MRRSSSVVLSVVPQRTGSGSCTLYVVVQLNVTHGEGKKRLLRQVPSMVAKGDCISLTSILLVREAGMEMYLRQISVNVSMLINV